MPFISSVRSSFGPQGRGRSLSVKDGLSSGNAFTTATEVRTAPSNGTYWIQTAGMSQARQYYIDTNNTNGPAGTKWVRIFLPSNFQGYNFARSTEDVDLWLNNADTPALIDSFSNFMYTFVNPTNNVRTQSWYFAKPSTNSTAFRNTPPTVHGGEGAPLITQITTVRMADGSSTTQFIRTGISSFGSSCDDGRGGYWGYICLKAGNTSSIASGGFSDFPSYATFSVNSNDNIIAHCSSSSQLYNATECSSTRNFAVYVG